MVYESVYGGYLWLGLQDRVLLMSNNAETLAAVESSILVMIIGSEKPEVKHPQVTSPNTHICTYIL
jgi:hypothetical protein